MSHEVRQLYGPCEYRLSVRHIVLIPLLRLVCLEELVVSRLQYALKETEKEYLLFIPYALKDRAKAIEGRHWDRDRGVLDISSNRAYL